LLLIVLRFEVWGVYTIVIIGFRLQAFKNLMPLLDHARIHLRYRSIRAAQGSLLLNQSGIRGQCVILSQPPAFLSSALILIRGLVFRHIGGFYLEACLKVIIFEMVAIYGLLRSVNPWGKMKEFNFDPKISCLLEVRARDLPLVIWYIALDYGYLRGLRCQRMLRF
jgi:hypothetical protein